MLMSDITNYQISTYIGTGDKSIVFEAFDLQLLGLGISKKVMVKIQWDLLHAKEEAMRLERADDRIETPTLLNYFETSSKDLYSHLADHLVHLEDSLLNGEPNAAVLILQPKRGLFIIDRRLYDGASAVDQSHERLAEDPWEIEVYLESLPEHVHQAPLETKFEILTKLGDLIKALHGVGIVSGDLTPRNILWDPTSRNVYLFDLGIAAYGFPGWRAKEHRDYVLEGWKEDAQPLPPGTDIWQFGVWMDRLLPQKGPWRFFIRKCLNPDHTLRPGIDICLEQLSAWRKATPRIPRLAKNDLLPYFQQS